MRQAALLLALVLAGCATPAIDRESGAAPGPATWACASCGPIEQGEGSAAEPTVASDPRDPDRLVAGAFDYEGVAGGARTFWLHAHVSDDGGASWTTARLPGGLGAAASHPLAGFTSSGDPAIAVLGDGTVVYAGIAARAATASVPVGSAGALSDLALFAARSPDGLTYPDDEIRVIARGRGAIVSALGADGFTPLDIPDRVSIARAADDRLVLVWTNFLVPSAEEGAALVRANVMASASGDGGRTWSEPAIVSRGFHQHASAAFLDDGTIVVTFVDVADGSTMAHVARSADALTWEPASSFDAHVGGPPVLRASGNELVVVQLLGEDIVLRRSLDRGASWSDPAHVAPSTATKPLPTLALAHGAAWIGWYGGADDALVFQAARVADDGSVSTYALSGPSAPGPATREYVGVAPTSEGAYAVWIGGDWPRTDVHGGPMGPSNDGGPGG